MKSKSSPGTGPIAPETKAHLIRVVKNSQSILEQKTITAGFDGFIDTIVKLIWKKQKKKAPSLFTTIEQFGNYILEKKGASFSLELEQQSIKLGGNMPIMANALGRLGTNVNCIGALGEPQIHAIFQNFPPNCHTYSFANPGTSTAFEFNDGKMMLADMGTLNVSGWEVIKNKIGMETLAGLYSESDMFCLLNWSEIDASTDIWKGLSRELFAAYPDEKKKIIFADLSDCSKRSPRSVTEALDLLREFGKHHEVILSLNKNEAGVIYKTIIQKKTPKELIKTGSKLFERLGVQTLVLHTSRETVAISGSTTAGTGTFFTANPKISTGAGDNFNAGFCIARLLQLDLEPALHFANAVSGYYIRSGASAGPNEIIEFLETI